MDSVRKVACLATVTVSVPSTISVTNSQVGASVDPKLTDELVASASRVFGTFHTARDASVTDTLTTAIRQLVAVSIVETSQLATIATGVSTLFTAIPESVLTFLAVLVLVQVGITIYHDNTGIKLYVTEFVPFFQDPSKVAIRTPTVVPWILTLRT